MNTALVAFLYQLADDEWITGHRQSEWLGLAPDLEEDIAFSSIAQDEVGHANYFYGLLANELQTTADHEAFERPAAERRNAYMLELPNGDWAYTIVRSYFYNMFEQVRLQTLLESKIVALRQGADKMLREERYHTLHMQTWFERLLIVGGVAKAKTVRAICELWPYLDDLFSLGEDESDIIAQGIFTKTPAETYAIWEGIVRPLFIRVGYEWPGNPLQGQSLGRSGHHSKHLDNILSTMVEVSGTDVHATW